MASELDKPAVLTVKVQREIVRLIIEGNFFEVACFAAGTTRQTVEYWQKLCESGVPHAQVYADFFASIKKANAIAEANALRDIKSGADGWQSRAWFLERRFKGRWGRNAEEKTETAGRRDVVTAARNLAENRRRNRGTDKPPG